MSTQSIGSSISILRKEKKVKQEELAVAVGVSTQAVSKWECGGMPDPELLPKIADFFNISIDRLFGRSVNDYGDLKEEVAKHIVSFDHEKRFNEAMEYCWIIEKALGGTHISERSLAQDLELRSDDKKYEHSQMLFETGISSFSLIKKLPYFYIMPEPEKGWENGFFPKEEYTAIFKMLGDPDIINSLYFLYKRENKPFTPKLLENKLKLPAEKAKQILKMLNPYGLIQETEIELDDTVQKVFSFNPNPAFIALLAITKEFIKRPTSFYNFCNSRNKAYL